MSASSLPPRRSSIPLRGIDLELQRLADAQRDSQGSSIPALAANLRRLSEAPPPLPLIAESVRPAAGVRVLRHDDLPRPPSVPTDLLNEGVPPMGGGIPLPRTPIRESSSPEGTLGRDAEAVEYYEYQHAAWEKMCGLQGELIRGRCCPQYAHGREAIRSVTERIPTLAALDAWLEAACGWRVVRAAGYVDPPKFMRLLSERKFPCMDQLRHADEVLYSPAPDMFHDIIGHLPLLLNDDFAEYYRIFGTAGIAARHEEQLRALDKIYWFTMEFGMLETDAEPLAYGAALITGLGELLMSAGDAVERKHFTIEAALETPTDVTRPNEVIYTASGFDEILDAFVDWAKSESLL